MASVFSPMQGEPGAEGERGPKGDKVCGRKSPAANGAAPWSKALGRGTVGAPLFGCQQALGGDGKVPACPTTLCLSPLQGEGGPRGEQGEPGEKGRDGAPVSTALSPCLALTLDPCLALTPDPCLALTPSLSLAPGSPG